MPDNTTGMALFMTMIIYYRFQGDGDGALSQTMHATTTVCGECVFSFFMARIAINYNTKFFFHFNRHQSSSSVSFFTRFTKNTQAHLNNLLSSNINLFFSLSKKHFHIEMHTVAHAHTNARFTFSKHILSLGGTFSPHLSPFQSYKFMVKIYSTQTDKEKFVL